MTSEDEPVTPTSRGDAFGEADAGGEPSEREIPCPVCGMPMPDLKGGKAAICRRCGFKDSCCF